MIILLSITSVVAVVAIRGWYGYYHALCGVLHYLKINGILATEEELKEEYRWAVKNSIKGIRNIFRRNR
ncbi:hypothetical protein [Clostridium sp.]|uniref:hypothetical protein n=1 Tax=Clostridium sp. TaxID=1506 RepID=UPI00262E06C5|nr:hypothetical protein [Clostridium sp.]